MLAATASARAQGQDVDDPALEEAMTAEGVLGAIPPLVITVLQDPVRIAPGESGKLILNVQLPPNPAVYVNAAGARAKHETEQGMLELGAARFDAAPKGGRYGRSFLVQIPVRVSPKASYGKLDVAGSLSLLGKFAPPEGRDGRAARVQGESNGVPWASKLVCGPSVPKPLVRKRVRRAKTAGDKASASEPKTLRRDLEAAAEDDESRLRGGRARPDALQGKDEALDTGGDGAGDDFAQEAEHGSLRWIFLALAGLGAVLLLVVGFARRGAG